MGPFLLSALAIALAVGALAVRRGRTQTRARLRAEWGQPVRRERRMDAMAASHRSRLSAAASGSLDARTWADLDMDAVFAALDRTASTLGQHALYHRLRTAPVAPHLDAFDALVDRLDADRGWRERAQIALSRLRDPHGYDLWWLGRPDAIDTRPWFVLFPLLTATTLLLAILAWVVPYTTPAFVGLFLINVAVRYLTDRRLIALATAFRQIAPLVTTAEALRYLDGDDIRPLVGAIRADTPSLRRLKTIARWIGGDPLMLPMDAGPLVLLAHDALTVAYDYLNLAFLLDGTGVYLGARDLRRHHGGLLRVIAAVGEVDAAISTASIRSGREWTRPRFRQPGAGAELADIRHPLLPDAVPNSVRLAPGRGLLITGSNMSGKSTFLRTVGTTAVLAQTLHTCLASAYDAPVFHVRSCIGRSDDLAGGKSYYLAEVDALLELVQASADTATHLFLLDELFRGTNAVERIAAGQAVLLELVSDARGPNAHVTIAATHDGELVDLLPDRYAAVHFGDAIGPDGLTFDHRLQPGPATTRNAIALLRSRGAPPDLVRRASACAAALDAQRGTTCDAR